MQGRDAKGRHVYHDVRGVQIPQYNSIIFDADNTSYPAANTAAVVTLAAPGAHEYHVVGSIYWSYDDDPTGGRLFVTAGGNIVFDVDITVGGPGFVFWQPPGEALKNLPVEITLAAGGAGISGKLSVHTWIEGG